MSGIDRRSFMMQAAGGIAGMALLSELALADPPVSSDPIRTAVIGMGQQGRAILGELAKLQAVKVVALCDADERRLGAAQRRSPDAAVYASHEALLENAREFDAVIIATPTHEHVAPARACIEAGKHVYLEAPIAHTIDDAKAIAAAARDAKGVFAVGLLARSNPIYKLARTFFRSDAVRDVVALRAQNFRKTSWRVPASDADRERAFNWRLDPDLSLGLEGEWGVHQYDVFQWYSTRYPSIIRGAGSIRLHNDGRRVDDTVHVQLGMSDKSYIDYQASLASSFGGRYEVLHGTNATIKLAWTHGWMFKEADAPTQGWEVYANRQQYFNDEGITLIADATKLASQGKLKEGIGLPNDSLYYGLEDFYRSIIENQPPVCTADEGMRATVVAILAHRAVVKGLPVTVRDEDLAGLG